jgi:tRNA(Glu) U13 pseudouridine synthase TruD
MNRRPASRLKYTHCIMYKEGIETSDAIGLIAKKLK